MKTISVHFVPVRPTGKVVARFGLAALIQDRLGRWSLSGGSPRDRSEAREWISLFGHEVLLERIRSRS